MPHTCATCAHWRPSDNHSLRRLNDTVGECRGGPPVADFKWPRSKAHDYCSSHSPNAVSFATADEPGAGLKPYPAPMERAQLFDAKADAAQASPARSDGPAAAVDAAAPQSTAGTAPAAPAGEGGASHRKPAGRSGSRRSNPPAP